jgi:hypothetical protein
MHQARMLLKIPDKCEFHRHSGVGIKACGSSVDSLRRRNRCSIRKPAPRSPLIDGVRAFPLLTSVPQDRCHKSHFSGAPSRTLGHSHFSGARSGRLDAAHYKRSERTHHDLPRRPPRPPFKPNPSRTRAAAARGTARPGTSSPTRGGTPGASPPRRARNTPRAHQSVLV